MLTRLGIYKFNQVNQILNFTTSMKGRGSFTIGKALAAIDRSGSLANIPRPQTDGRFALNSGLAHHLSGTDHRLNALPWLSGSALMRIAQFGFLAELVNLFVAATFTAPRRQNYLMRPAPINCHWRQLALPTHFQTAA
jgi:hypothetical protein